MRNFGQMEHIWWFDRLFWIGLGVCALYWFAESALHVFIFKDGTFASQIFINNPHELWKRLLIGALIIVFSFYAQQRLNERHQAEQALKESEKKYRTIFEDALNPILLFSEKGPFIDCNRAALDFLECRREDLAEKKLWDLSPYSNAEDRKVWFSPSNDYRNLETDFLINGRAKTLLLNLVPFSSKEQDMVYGIGQDISERKQMERDITLAHTELNHIFQTASVGMRLINKDFTVLKVNETFAALSGASAARSAGKKCYEIFAGPMCHKQACPLNRILGGAKEIESEIEKRREDGTTVSCLLTARPFLRPDGELAGIVESFKDITELKRAEEELKSERDKLHQIVFQRYEGVGIVRKDFSIEYQNEILIGQIGNSNGRRCYEVLMERKSPCTDCLLKEAIATGETKRSEFDTSSGKSFELTYTPFVESDGEEKVFMTMRDITQTKASRAAAIQSEQLAAIGSLAAGVAHEINNPINGIINYGQILVNKSGQKKTVKSVAERIVKEGDRIAKIVENLLAFTRRDKQNRTPVELSKLIEDTLTLTAAQMRKESIDVKVSVPRELPPIFVVVQEIQQVFLNVLNNAQYALNQKYPGSHRRKIIKISAAMVNSGGRSRIRVSFNDSGVGIPKAIIDKVMNPFFSTKPSGKGTGLGLSISHGIISDHDGRLSIRSVEGKYTRVDIELPMEKKTQHKGGVG